MIIRKCPNCGSSNPDQAAFCTECGSSLAEAKIICPGCGGENDKRARFCMACGSKLDKPLLKEAEEIAPEDQAVSGEEDMTAPAASEGDAGPRDRASYDERSLTAQAVSEERVQDFQTDTAEESIEKHSKEKHGIADDSIEKHNEEKHSKEKRGITEHGIEEHDIAEHSKEEYGLEKHRKEEHSIKDAGKGENGKKQKTIFVILGLAAAALIVIFFALNSGPRMESLEVAYDGDTAAGTVLDKSNKGIRVVGVDQDGEKYELTDWTIEDPQTLEMDSSATVTISYEDLSRKLTVDCSTSELVGISATYNGDAEAGVVLDSDNDGFEVTASYKNGDEEVVTGWTIEKPQTLAADSTAAIVIEYEGKQCSLDVICTTISIEKIQAEYSGSTKAGVEIGEGSSDVTVSAVYKNGETQAVTGWTVDEPVTLEAGKTSKLKIHYGDHDCTLKVECTDMSEKQYKAKCKTYSYEEIARDPDDYKGKKAKFSGTVLQALEGDDGRQVDIRLAIDGDYDQVIYVVYYKPEGSSRILEDDTITVYGELAGLYSYTSTMNKPITLPIIYALYTE